MVIKIELVRGIVRYKGKYLFLKKAKDKFYPENVGKWECVGGIVEDSNAKETILKELKEESGLNGEIIKKLPFLSMVDDKYDSRCFVFLVEVEDDKVKLSDEHLEYKWVKAEETKELKLVIYASLLLEYFNNEEKYL